MNIERAKEAGISIDLTTLNPTTQPGAPSTEAGAPSFAPFAKGGVSSEARPSYSDAAQTPIETRWILTRLSETCTAVDRSLTDYRFDEAANIIYQFFWGDLCDWYLELSKLRLNFDEGSDKQTTTAALKNLTAIFEASLRLLSPFMPFITEEIWHALYNGAPPAKSIALTRYPQAADFEVDEVAIIDMAQIQSLIVEIRSLRKDNGVTEKEITPVRIGTTDQGLVEVFEESLPIIQKLARTSEIKFSERFNVTGARSTFAFDVAITYERQIDVPAERERYTKDLVKYEKGLAAAERQLNNEAFTAKAPAHIIEGLRKQAAETKVLYDKTKAALDALPPG